MMRYKYFHFAAFLKYKTIDTAYEKYFTKDYESVTSQ